MTDQRKDEIDTSPLGEFDRFCRFIDGIHMGGFVENDFMCKAVQKKIREDLLRADLSPPVPVDTISIKREVLQGVRDNLKSVYDGFDKGKRDKFARYRPTRAQGDAAWFAVTQSLASLDAVLSEGE